MPLRRSIFVVRPAAAVAVVAILAGVAVVGAVSCHVIILAIVMGKAAAAVRRRMLICRVATGAANAEILESSLHAVHGEGSVADHVLAGSSRRDGAVLRRAAGIHVLRIRGTGVRGVPAATTTAGASAGVSSHADGGSLHKERLLCNNGDSGGGGGVVMSSEDDKGR